MEAAVKKKHSEFGIASISIGILDIILWILNFTFALKTTRDRLVVNQYYCYSSLVLLILAFVLGICGLFQKNRERILPVIGILLFALDFIFAACLLVLFFMGLSVL